MHVQEFPARGPGLLRRRRNAAGSVLTQLEPIHLRYLAATIKAEQAIAAGSGGAGNPTVTFVATMAKMPPEIAASAAERLHAFALLTDRLGGDMVNWTRGSTRGFCRH